MKATPARFVVCLTNRGHRESLVLRRLYPVFSDATAEEHGLLRIVDESGEDYLYPKRFFAEVELPKSVERKLAAAR